VVRRRRMCLKCSRRYTTYERAEEDLRLRVIKKDGSRVPYDRQKIIAGLQKACYKRPVTDEQIRQIIEATEEEIFRTYEKDVPSSFIGDTVSRNLSEVDKIAYVRFASVYFNFSDLDELIGKATEVKNSSQAPPKNQKKLFDQND